MKDLMFKARGNRQEATGKTLTEIAFKSTAITRTYPRESSTKKTPKMTTSTLKKWGVLLYFFFTGWGVFWVMSFLRMAGANAQSIPAETGMAQIDIAFSDAEDYANRSISGSYQEGFEKPCTGGCAHIELTGNPSVIGQQWVSGNSQKVKGGHGALASMFNGVEPTGRHPYGDEFKVVIGHIDESTGMVDFELYYRICEPYLGCSPYGVGPFPFMTVKEGDWIFF